MQCDTMKWYASYSKSSLNRIYMILLQNMSRVHDPWGTRKVHMPTRTIYACLCGLFQCTFINQKNLHGRSPRAQIIIITFLSHERSPRVQIIITRSQHGRSPCVRPLLMLNLMSMHVHNMISIKGDDTISQYIKCRWHIITSIIKIIRVQ